MMPDPAIVDTVIEIRLGHDLRVIAERQRLSIYRLKELLAEHAPSLMPFIGGETKFQRKERRQTAQVWLFVNGYLT